MAAFISQTGMFGWFQLLITLILLYITAKNSFLLCIRKGPLPDGIDQSLAGLVFWGAFAAVFGFFAHYLGMFNALQAISAANEISPAAVSGSCAASLLTVLAGLAQLLFGMIAWFILKHRYRTRVQGDT